MLDNAMLHKDRIGSETFLLTSGNRAWQTFAIPEMCVQFRRGNYARELANAKCYEISRQAGKVPTQTNREDGSRWG